MEWRDAEVDSLLHLAVHHHAQNIAKTLVSRGFSVDVLSFDGQSVLYAAALMAKPAIFEELLSLDAGPHIRDKDGFSILHAAAKDVDRNIVKVVLRKGLPVESRQTRCNTAPCLYLY